ncbi:MAG: heme-binding protein [Candidatus Sericytochromatia bacterium]|nr:heme-binding protein [Candidatus Sericytochromatia bacterium]
MTWLEAIAGGLGAIATGVGSIFGLETVEEPAYEVLRREGPCELRRYAPHTIAETRVTGEFRRGQSEGFRRLARYIFGGNQVRRELPMTAPVTLQGGKATLPMTAPVTMEPQPLPMTAPVTMEPQPLPATAPAGLAAGEGEWTMTFVLPAGVTAANAPQPLDEAVTVRDLPAQEIAAIRFSGLYDEATFRQQEGRLRAWLPAGREPAGPARWAGYNPPFTLPFLRRNEVLLPLRPAAGGR